MAGSAQAAKCSPRGELWLLGMLPRQLLVLWGLLSCSMLTERVAVFCKPLPVHSHASPGLNSQFIISSWSMDKKRVFPCVFVSRDRSFLWGSGHTTGVLLLSTEENASRDLIPDRHMDVKLFPDTITFSWYCFHIQDKDLFSFWRWGVIVQSGLVGEKTSLWSALKLSCMR